MELERKSALVIKATKDTYCELEAITEAFKYHDIDIDAFDLTKPDDGKTSDSSDGNSLDYKYIEDLDEIEGGKWSYVYLCAHGSGNDFGDDNLGISFEWESLSREICDKLSPGATFMLACCRGGFSHVAYHLFANCGSIDTITGPRYNALPGGLRVGFQAFLHHLEARKNDPTQATEAASSAAGIQFLSYESLETTTSYAYLLWLAENPPFVEDEDAYKITEIAS